MKINLNSSVLLKNLQHLIGVIPSSSTMAILDNFLFKITSDKLKIEATDLETTMTISIDGKFDIPEGEHRAYAVPAKMLIEILKSLPEQPLDFQFKENANLEIKSASGNYEISYADGNEFPKSIILDNPATTSMPSDVLVNAITKTIFAAGNDDLRPVMTGVLFSLKNSGTTFVATDAHKLVKYCRTDIVSSEDADFIMPKKPLNLLKAILSPTKSQEVLISFNNNNASFEFDGCILVCRLIDGKYPNYEAVIPKENDKKLLIDRAQFMNSVACVSIFSNKTTNQIRLKLAGSELHLSADDKDYSNKADERLTCDYTGADIYIGFNSKFLAEMLRVMKSEQIQIEMSAPNRAGILTPVDGLEEGESLLMLVMPSLITDK